MCESAARPSLLAFMTELFILRLITRGLRLCFMLLSFVAELHFIQYDFIQHIKVSQQVSFVKLDFDY